MDQSVAGLAVMAWGPQVTRGILESMAHHVGAPSWLARPEQRCQTSRLGGGRRGARERLGPHATGKRNRGDEIGLRQRRIGPTGAVRLPDSTLIDRTYRSHQASVSGET